MAVVTFLFVDMVGSTDLLSSVGDRANDEIRKDVFDVLRRPLVVVGGTEVKYLGDGLMAAFADLDDAIAAAVAMHQGVMDLDAAGNYLPLALRVGIARGEATPDAGDWHGTAVVEAARLCSLAAPGQVLLTDRAIAESPRLSWPVHTVGALRLKGFPDLVDCSEVAWTPQPAGGGLPVPPAFSLRGAPAFVGRQHELDRLAGAWRAVAAGDGRSVLISGPPRAGSTRLVAQLVEQSGATGNGQRPPLILRGAARRGDLGHGAVIEALRWPVWWGDRSLWEAVHDLPGVGSLFPSAPTRFGRPQTDRDPAGPRPSEAADVAERVLRTWAQTSTLMLVLEDLQWADADALNAIVDLFSARVPGLLQLATFRTPDHPDSPVATILVDKLQWSSHAVSIDVPPLRRDAVAGLLATGGVEASEARRWAPEVAARVGTAPGDVAQAAKRLRRLGRSEPGPVRAALSLVAPYRGLVAYDEADAGVFFGRQQQVDWLVDRVRRDRFLVLVGASGSGKSSLLRAGLAARLRAGHGQARVVSPALNRTVDWLHHPALIIDQFEETFSVLPDADRAPFLDAVVEAVNAALDWDLAESDSPVAPWLAIGLRADFYASCASEPRLASLMTDHTVLVGSVSADDVRPMVESPAAAAGVALETGLADVVSAEVEGEPHPLPLVSQALHEAWRRRVGARITIADYREAGGVRGAISASAERVYTTELDSTEQAAARRLLLRAIEVEGPGDRPTRRPIALADVSDPSEMAVVDRLVAARLIVADDRAIALAHEALIEAWPRLGEWIAEDRDRLVVARRLSRAAAEWDHSGRPETDLYRGARLEAAVTLYADSRPPPVEAAFIDASVAAEERNRSRLVRTNRRLRRLLTGAAVAAVVSLIAGIVAVTEARRASHERNQAEAGLRSEQISRLASEAESLSGSNISLAALLAVEAYRLAARPDTLSALETVLRAQPAIHGVVQLAGLPSGAALLSGNQTGSVACYASSGIVLAVSTASFHAVGRPLHVANPTVAAVSPDGRLLVVGTVEHSLVVENLVTGQTGPAITLAAPATSLSFLSDSELVAGAYSGQLATVDLTTRAVSTTDLGDMDFGGAEVVAADPSAHLIAVSLNGGVASSTTPLDFVAAGDLKTIRHLVLPAGGSTSLSVQPGGHLLAVGTSDHGVLLFDTRTGAQVASPARSTISATALFSPDGRRLAVLDNAGIVNVYASATRRPVIAAATQATNGTAAALDFGPDGRSLVELSGRQAIEISLDDAQALAPAPFGHPGDGAGAISGNGRVAFTQDMSGTGTLTFSGASYDPATGRQLLPTRPDNLAEFSPDGSFIIGTSASGQYVETFSAAGQMIARSHADGNGYLAVAINRSFSVMATIGVDQSGVVLERLPRMTVLPSRIGTDGLTLAAADLSDDGTLLARAGTFPTGALVEPSVVDITRVADGKTVVRYQLPSGNPLVTQIAFSPNGRLVAVGDNSGNIGLFDIRSDTFQPAVFTGIHGAVNQLLFTGDGRYLFAGGTDGTLWWWDAATHTPIGNPFPTAENPLLSTASIDLNGRWLVVSGPAGLTRWDIDPATWPAIACQLAGRNLTRTEWATYVPSGVPYQQTCPATPP